MLAHYYFDLKGTSSERAEKVKKYGDTLKKACEKMGCKFLGIWGPANDKYHFVAMIDAEDMNGCMRPYLETERPEDLYHIEFKFYGKVYPE